MYTLENVDVFDDSNVGINTTRDADRLHTVDELRGGMARIAIGALIRLQFTAEEAVAGDATPLDQLQAAQFFTVKDRNHMERDNVTAIGTLLQGLNDGTLSIWDWINFLPSTNLAATSGDHDLDIVYPIPFCTGPFVGRWNDFEGAIPVTEFKQEAKLSVTLGGALGAYWRVKNNVFTRVRMSLIVVNVPRMPMPVHRTFYEKYANDKVEKLDCDPSRASRLMSLMVRDYDEYTDVDVSQITGFSLTIDGQPYIHGAEGDQHEYAVWAANQDLMNNLQNLPSAGSITSLPKCFQIITAGNTRSEDTALVTKEAILKDADAGMDPYYVHHIVQYRPPTNVAKAILKRNRVADADIEQAFAEEADSQYNAVAFEQNGPTPIQVVPGNHFLGRSRALLPVGR